MPFVLLALHNYGVTPDDTFITMRYAANVLDGHGPVFNPGDRVEGFSSPAHLALEVIVLAVPGGHAALRVKLLSLLFGAMALRQAIRLLDRTIDCKALRGAGRWLLGSSAIIVWNSVSGLDTSMAMWATTGLGLALVEESRSADVRRRGTWALAAILIRPEAVGLVAIAALASFAAAHPRPRFGSRWLVVPIVGLMALLTLRLAYYGMVVPNTAVAKRLPLGRAALEGLEYLRASLRPPEITIGPIAGWATSHLLAAMSLLAFAVGAATMATKRRELLPLVALVAGQVLFVLYAGGDAMHIARFVAPVLPIAIVLQVVGVRTILGSRRSPISIALAACLVAAPLLTSRPTMRPNGLPTPSTTTDAALARTQSEALANAPRMLRCARPGWTVAYSEMGYGPWIRRDLRFIDYRGLVDAEIARHPNASQRYVYGVGDPVWDPEPSGTAAIVLRRDPELIIVGDVEAYGGPRSARYLLVDLLVIEGWSYGVFVRRDVAARCD